MYKYHISVILNLVFAITYYKLLMDFMNCNIYNTKISKLSYPIHIITTGTIIMDLFYSIGTKSEINLKRPVQISI